METVAHSQFLTVCESEKAKKAKMVPRKNTGEAHARLDMKLMEHHKPIEDFEWASVPHLDLGRCDWKTPGNRRLRLPKLL